MNTFQYYKNFDFFSVAKFKKPVNKFFENFFLLFCFFCQKRPQKFIYE